MRFAAAIVVSLLVFVAFSGCGSKTNRPPVAQFVVVAGTGGGNVFTFDGTRSTDPDGDALTYSWNFGDGRVGPGPAAPDHRYNFTNALVLVVLIVKDPHGARSMDFKQVTLGNGNNSVPGIDLKNMTRWVKPGASLVFDATKTHDRENDALSFDWSIAPYTGPRFAPLVPPPDPAPVETGYLGPGASNFHVFNRTGTFYLHCHPHPWMKSQVVVEDTGSSDPVNVDIEGFAYDPPRLVVRNGTRVTWTNRDPLEHTATKEFFAAGQTEGRERKFEVAPASGDHLVSLYVSDGKGGVAAQTWGLRLHADAPVQPNVTVLTWTFGPPTLPRPAAEEFDSVKYKSTWPQNMTLEAEWSNPGDAQDLVVRVRDAFDPKPIVVGGPCTAADADLQSRCTMSANLDAKDYLFTLRSTETIVNATVTFTVTAQEWLSPGFGDSAGGHAHHH